MAGLLINIDVSDLAAAVDFYTSGLGLEVARHLGPDIVELGGAPSPIYLTRRPALALPFPGAAAPRDFRRHWTPVHLDFVVPDLEAALRRAESAGATREGEIHDFEWGRYAVLADPFGHGFCLLHFKGDGYASVESGS
jgi:predicted enzyme related to lactoylglutathione lyase